MTINKKIVQFRCAMYVSKRIFREFSWDDSDCLLDAPTAFQANSERLVLKISKGNHSIFFATALHRAERPVKPNRLMKETPLIYILCLKTSHCLFL